MIRNLGGDAASMMLYGMLLNDFSTRSSFFFVIHVLFLFLYRRHMINLKQQAVIVHGTTQVYRQQYVACQLYRHDFSNDVVSTVKHRIITNYHVCISDIVFQYHSFQPHFTRYPQYLHKNPSNFQPSGSPTFQLFPEVHQRFWLVWAVELASQLFLGAVWHFFIRVVPWITWMRIPNGEGGKSEKPLFKRGDSGTVPTEGMTK